MPAKSIHEWETAYKEYDVEYLKPIVNVKKARLRAKEVYKKALK